MALTIAKHMLYYVLLAFVAVGIYAALSGHAQAAETAVTASQTITASLVDIIQQVSGGVKQGVSFLQQEIPDVVKQLLTWKLVEAMVTTIVCLLYLFSWAYFTVKAFKCDNDVLFIPVVIIGGCIALFATAFAYASLLMALKIYIAPKVWLIEYAASLVK